MTRTSRMSRRGVIAATAIIRRRLSRSRLIRVRASEPEELQVDAAHPQDLAAEKAQRQGQVRRYPVEDVNPDMSMLECLDVLNETLIEKGEEPVAFEHDCREGICGSCGFMINGVAHGPLRGDHGLPVDHAPLQRRRGTDARALARDGISADQRPGGGSVAHSTASSLPVGYISVSTGSAPDGNAIPVPKEAADRSMDAAACIGCGACVAACPNASAALFTGAKIAHLGIVAAGTSRSDMRSGCAW